MTHVFEGVLPAITTPFNDDMTVDHAYLARHAAWMIDQGCRGVIPLGSLGESATLEFHEKVEIVRTLVDALGNRAPVIPGVAALSTAQGVALARAARDAGCRGLMILPPYVYASDWREMKAHVSAIIGATDLPVILYNNPIAYGTDFLPEQILELVREHANVRGVKESSGDARRVTALRALLPADVSVLVGLDDMLVEGVRSGAAGWVAGLVNAFPAESVQLFDLACSDRTAEADALYRWFLPLLRLDTEVKFVQLIKFVQEEVGRGSARVRAPRLELTPADQERVRGLLVQAFGAPHPVPA